MPESSPQLKSPQLEILAFNTNTRQAEIPKIITLSENFALMVAVRHLKGRDVQARVDAINFNGDEIVAMLRDLADRLAEALT
jgi:Holliday junction resolvase-like predicted endonuclease